MQLNNFKMTIEYDGSDFHGWQRQKGCRTVQAEIEVALHTLTRRKITVIGSGRTDAGVHALGQVASFKCDTRLDPGTIQKALNSLLPDAIVIRDCKPAAPTFHARYDARCKTYRYRILNHPLAVAVGRQYAWHLRRPLDLDAMRRAAAILVGRHDFSAFEAAGSPRSHAVRQVFKTFIAREEKAEFLAFDIEADGFLRFMVRNIVGTLVMVGSGKIGGADFEEILLSKERKRAGATAPPHGLFLMCVSYG
ncbi:MAG: tRNA pseudouridine(38-40) synthase TruA [Desulfobacterales bacterium]|jgi:tRNA pseudouridine38-40 synthase